MIFMLANILLDNPQPAIAARPFREIVRVRITQRLHGSIDGMQLDRFQRGHVYDVGSMLGAVLLAEGWAEPADDYVSTVSTLTSVRQFAEPTSVFTWRRRTPIHHRAIAADRQPRSTSPKSQKGR
jgi:hypothetical protein